MLTPQWRSGTSCPASVSRLSPVQTNISPLWPVSSLTTSSSSQAATTEPSNSGTLKQVGWSGQGSWTLESIILIAGDFIRDLIALESGGSGGVVWRIRSSPTKLVTIETVSQAWLSLFLFRFVLLGLATELKKPSSLFWILMPRWVRERDSCREFSLIIHNLGEVTNRTLSSREERDFPDNSGHNIVK